MHQGRFEADFAVLIDNNGKIKNIPASYITDAKEGDTVAMYDIEFDFVD